MKNLITTIACIIIPLSAFAADPIRLNGTYTFDSVEFVQARDVEVVPVQNPSRVEELRSQKFVCESVANFNRCTKFSESREIPRKIFAAIESEWKDKDVKFTQSANSVVVTNESEDLLEWDIHDMVTVGDNTSEMYQYYLLSAGIHKIKVPFALDDQWFVIQNDKKISAHFTKTVQLSRFIMKDYVMFVHLTKN